MSSTPSIRARELMADAAIGALRAGESRELDGLVAAGHAADAESYELAAAAVHLAFVASALTPMPDSLRQRVARAVHGSEPGDPPSYEHDEVT